MNAITVEKKPGTGSEDQTFLVGEQVYLRTFAPGDEKNATSWRPSIFPKSPEQIKKWIKKELPKEGGKGMQHLAIVRKVDDDVVGSMALHHDDISIEMDAYVDVLYGELGQTWLAEAIVLAAHWKVDECFTANLDVQLPATHVNVIVSLLQHGFVQTVRMRETIELNGERIDKLTLSYFNQRWVDRIGNAMDVELPRLGNSDIQPVPAKTLLESDPPKQAVMIGPRVYLRPQDKEDAKYFVEAARLETETFFDIGRGLLTTVQWSDYLGSATGEDFPHTLWFTVCLRENDEAIGSVGLMDIDYVNRVAETGTLFFKPEHRGQGYGPEAKHLLLQYTFDVLGFHTVTSRVYFSNPRSAAALRKQGYSESGRRCWLYPFEGGFGNMAAFDLLASEWRALPREG